MYLTSSSCVFAILALTNLLSLQPVAGQQSCTVPEHRQALQRLSNGQSISYDDTLRVVNHHCTKFPRTDFTPQHKAPGYIRNQLGGFFTS